MALRSCDDHAVARLLSIPDRVVGVSSLSRNISPCQQKYTPNFRSSNGPVVSQPKNISNTTKTHIPCSTLDFIRHCFLIVSMYSMRKFEVKEYRATPDSLLALPSYTYPRLHSVPEDSSRRTFSSGTVSIKNTCMSDKNYIKNCASHPAG